jgi:para-nitrobenzyl esterase
MRKSWLGAALAALALLCGRPAAAQLRIVTVAGARIEGVSAGGVVSFKGIPFAAPPVGALRWRAPQPVRPWTGIKKADRFGPSCIQDPGLVKVFGAPPAISEDCLYLNVWTPAASAHERLPVMVWIYGGGFFGGMTSVPAYDGTQLARKGVVLVSVAYRLGVFGFLAAPELSRENGGHSGNYGLLDMIAGLEWVKANIARFGGDPSRVTVFGESAGGEAVSMLASSPLAKGLFERGISESGGSLAPPQLGRASGENVPLLAEAEADGQRFLAQLGASDIAAARALPADVIQKAVGTAARGGFRPVFDGHVLPGDEYELYREGRFNDTPVLIGTNADEGRAFAAAGMTPARFEAQIRAGFGQDARAILAAYPHATDAEAEEAARDVARDSTFAWGTWAWALLQSEKGKGRAYLYYFDRRSPQAPLGPSHGAEIGYVFGNLGGPGGGPAGLRGPPGPADVALSQLIENYWVNFAKTGDPNGPGLPAWPAFTLSSERAMFLDEHASARPVPNMRQLRTLDGYFALRRKEARSVGAEP